MSTFEVRSAARFNMAPGEWGTDVDSHIVDSVRKTLEEIFDERGYSHRDYNAARETEEERRGSPLATVFMSIGGESLLEAAEGSIYARAYYKEECSPRQEPVMIDDGGTIISGSFQGDVDKVFKIAVRDVNGKNAELREEIESLLMSRGINITEAQKGIHREEGTAVYGLKRFKSQGGGAIDLNNCLIQSGSETR